MMKPSKITASELVLSAVFFLQQKNGVTSKEITKFIADKRGLKQSQIRTEVIAALEKATKSGIFSKQRGQYRIENQNLNTPKMSKIKLKKVTSNAKKSKSSFPMKSSINNFDCDFKDRIKMFEKSLLPKEEASNTYFVKQISPFTKVGSASDECRNPTPEEEEKVYIDPYSIQKMIDDDDDADDFLDEEDDDDDDDDDDQMYYFEQSRGPENKNVLTCSRPKRPVVSKKPAKKKRIASRNTRPKKRGRKPKKRPYKTRQPRKTKFANYETQNDDEENQGNDFIGWQQQPDEGQDQEEATNKREEATNRRERRKPVIKRRRRRPKVETEVERNDGDNTDRESGEADENNAEENNTEENNADENNANKNNADENNADENNADENNADDNNIEEINLEENNADENNADENNADDNRTEDYEVHNDDIDDDQDDDIDDDDNGDDDDEEEEEDRDNEGNHASHYVEDTKESALSDRGEDDKNSQENSKTNNNTEADSGECKNQSSEKSKEEFSHNSNDPEKDMRNEEFKEKPVNEATAYSTSGGRSAAQKKQFKVVEPTYAEIPMQTSAKSQEEYLTKNEFSRRHSFKRKLPSNFSTKEKLKKRRKEKEEEEKRKSAHFRMSDAYEYIN